MMNIQSDSQKLQAAIILLVLCIKCIDAELKPTRSFDLFDFERMKMDIFTRNISEGFDYENVTRNELKCLEELRAIGKGLTDSELWAIKSKST